MGGATLPGSTAALVELLDALLGPGSEEVVPAPAIARLAVALDPPDPATLGDVDAVLLHRSHGFAPPPGVGVVACHDPFDRALGLAHNRFLHDDLGLTGARALAPKATLHAAPPGLARSIAEAFGGVEHTTADDGPAGTAVLADAMSADLVARAAAAGARLYVTGTFRPSAREAVQRTGIGVVAIGHRRQERWSLGRLARLIVQAGFTPDVCMR